MVKNPKLKKLLQSCSLSAFPALPPNPKLPCKLQTTIFTVGGTTAAGTAAGVTVGAAASAGITGSFTY